jgi:ABC-type transport system involved in multi-copper enzyme maturation permease subunit
MNLWRGLLAGEVIKLRRTSSAKAVALAILLGPLAVVLALRLVSSDISDIVESPSEIVVGTVALMAAIGIVVLGAASLGREFDSGTARTLLLHGASRGGWITAKAAVLLVTIAAASLCAVAAGLVAVSFAGWRPGGAQVADVLATTLALIPLACLPYFGATALGAIVGRSTAAGMLAGLALFLGDFLLSTLRTSIPFAEWLPVANLFVLLGDSFSSILPSEVVAPAWVAAMRLLLVGAGLIGGATWLFRRQDVTG